MSTTNFFLLRLDRFFQLLNTSSVIIGVEFVFSNLCLAVSENLLSLSLQESPNQFIIRVMSLSFLSARHKSANNGSPFYDDWQTTTDRTTGLLLFHSDRLVFGSHEGASDRWWRHRSRSHQGTAARLRTPGCIRHKPLWWSGRWAHSLWRIHSRPGCQGPQRKYARYLPTTLRKLRMSGSRNSKVMREMMRKEMKWREKSKRSEATLTVRMKREDDHGDSNLSHSVRTSKQGRQSRDDDTNWQQRRDRDYEKRKIFFAW